MINFILAGRDTTATCLSWMLCGRARFSVHFSSQQPPLAHGVVPIGCRLVLVIRCRVKFGTHFRYCLAKNPAAEARLRSEIARQGYSDFSFEVVCEANMPYLHAAITETLRLFVVICAAPRYARPQAPAPTCFMPPPILRTCVIMGAEITGLCGCAVPHL